MFAPNASVNFFTEEFYESCYLCLENAQVPSEQMKHLRKLFQNEVKVCFWLLFNER